MTLTRINTNSITDGSIVNADISASAAIAGTKISPDFGSQNVTTTGTSTSASFIPSSSTVPSNGVYLPAANSVGISTNSTERLRITSTGVGIGTTSAGSYSTYGNKLVIYGTGTDGPGMTIATGTSDTGSIYFADGTTGNEIARGAVQYAHASDALLFQTAATERFRCDSSGRLLVGTSSSPSGGTGQYAKIVTQGYIGSDTSEGVISIQRGTAASSITANQAIGVVTFGDSTGQAFGQIYCYADANAGASDYPGRLVFSTTADGASSPTERMRITQDGRVGIKETSFLGNAALAIGSSGSTNNDVYLRNNGTQALSLGFVQAALTSKSIACTTNDRINIFSNSDTSTGVYLTAGGTSWTSTSDERVKENLNPIQDGLSKVSSLRAVTGNYINDPLKKTVPFLLAQDVEQVLPEAVDSTDPDELGLSYTALIPLLVAALKESKERIETLEAKVAALESPAAPVAPAPADEPAAEQ